MAVTSPKEVTSGFFRVHLWVLLGLGTFGSLVAYSRAEFFDQPKLLLGLAITVTVLSYVGSVIWLYEKHRAGQTSLWLITALTFFMLLLYAHPSKEMATTGAWIWLILDIGSGSLLLGATFAAMLLGHWYLNSPTMKLDPLRGLVRLMVIALIARMLVSLTGVSVRLSGGELRDGFEIAGVALRWLAGIAGLGGMTWMTWQTLKIPNTQSATGILYVALVFVFLGELASAMLSHTTVVPV